jgi:hypothetical protein
MRENGVRLRSSTLWVPGVLVVVLGVLIHAHVASLHRRARLIADNAVACTLPVDLGSPTSQEATFVPAVSRKFAFSLVLCTAAADDDGHSPSEDTFPDNAIAQSLKAATFTVAWQLRSERQSDVAGVISEKNLQTRIKADHIRYVFGNEEVPLKAGRSYRLFTEVAGSSAALNDFAPALVVETSSPLKGHPLARWRLRDTGLLLFLGVCLISLGLSKRHSDRKKRRKLKAVQPVAEP